MQNPSLHLYRTFFFYSPLGTRRYKFATAQRIPSPTFRSERERWVRRRAPPLCIHERWCSVNEYTHRYVVFDADRIQSCPTDSSTSFEFDYKYAPRKPKRSIQHFDAYFDRVRRVGRKTSNQNTSIHDTACYCTKIEGSLRVPVCIHSVPDISLHYQSSLVPQKHASQSRFKNEHMPIAETSSELRAMSRIRV